MSKQATIPEVHQYGLFEPPLPLEFADLEDICSPLEKRRADREAADAAGTKQVSASSLEGQDIIQGARAFSLSYGDALAATAHLIADPFRFWRRHVEVRRGLGHALLLVRVGNHLEAWGADAETIADELEFPIRRRRISHGGKDTPRCDVEHWQLKTVAHVLGMAGYAVEVRNLQLNEREG